MDILVKGKILQTFGAKALVQSEHMADPIRFIFTDPPEGGYDLNWSLMWVDESDNGDIAILDKTLEDGNLVLTWNPTRTQTQSNGKLTIQLKGTETTSGNETRRWLSIVSYLTVPSTLNPGTVQEIEPELFDHYYNIYQGLYNQYKAALDSAISDSSGQIATYTTQKKAELASKEQELEGTLNQYATTKKTEITSHVASKTEDFDLHVSQKTSAFDSNATAKTSAFDGNAVDKTNSFNDNYTAKKANLKTFVDEELAADLITTTNGCKDDLGVHTNTLKSNLNTYKGNLEDELDQHVSGVEASITELANTKVSDAFANQFPSDSLVAQAIEEAWV